MNKQLIFKCPCGNSHYDVEYDISYDDWIKKYKPIKNPINNHNDFVDGYFIDNYDKKEYEWLCNFKGNQIWTLHDDGSIVSGFWRINREGYIVTEMPYCESSDDDGKSYKMINVFDVSEAEYQCRECHIKIKKNESLV